MERPSNVRMARADEEDQIYELLMKLYDENALFSLDEKKVREVIRMATEGRFGVIGIIDGPNGIEGSVGLSVTQWWYTSEWHLGEYWNFVREDCRQSNHAKDLINFSKWCAETMHLPLHMGIVTTKRTAAKERLYRRILPKVGAFFMYNAKGVDLPAVENDDTNGE